MNCDEIYVRSDFRTFSYHERGRNDFGTPDRMIRNGCVGRRVAFASSVAANDGGYFRRSAGAINHGKLLRKLTAIPAQQSFLLLELVFDIKFI